MSSCWDPYSSPLILRDVASTPFSAVGATVFVDTITNQARLGNIEPRDSHKIIHTFSAPLFILLWPLYLNAYGVRVFASVVLLLNALRLIVAGTSGGGGGPSGSHLSIREFEGGAGGSLYIRRGVSLCDVLLLDRFARWYRLRCHDGRG